MLSMELNESHGTVKESTEEECQIQIHIPRSLSPKTLRKASKENVNPSDLIKNTEERKEKPPDFDGGCWEMLNQDAIQILPPRPNIPTKPTTSCIKPTFKEREKKGKLKKWNKFSWLDTFSIPYTLSTGPVLIYLLFYRFEA